jgi:hypothetical protein
VGRGGIERGRRQGEFFGRVFRIGDVVIEEAEVDPLHLPTGEGGAEGRAGEIDSEVIVHALATEADQDRALVEAGKKPRG